MGRLKRNVLIFRHIPPEWRGQKFAHKLEGIPPEWSGQRVGYRHGLVLWLNRTLSRKRADREAGGRVGHLIKCLNESSCRWSTVHKQWIRKSANADDTIPLIRSLKEIAPCYKFGINLFPSGDGRKWELHVSCVMAPSGDLLGSGLETLFNDLNWVDALGNPELLAVEAVIHTALDGLLGTIKQCEVHECSKWFLARNDDRTRCCPDHGADDLRKGTPKRRKQLAAAAKRVREREKTRDEKDRTLNAEAGRSTPVRHRAND
jgi:hypothetical protein